MSDKERNLSETCLKNHEVQPFEIFHSNLERYFQDFQQQSDIDQVIIPDYPPILSAQQSKIGSNLINVSSDHQGSIANIQKNGTICNTGEITDRSKTVSHTRISLRECLNAEFDHLPSKNSHNDTSPLSSNATVFSSSHSMQYYEYGFFQVNEFASARTPGQYPDMKMLKDNRDYLQSLLHIPFNLCNAAPKTADFQKEPWSDSVDEACRILSAPISFDEFFNRDISRSLNFESKSQIPQTVIEATIDNINYLSKKSIEKSAIKEDIKHFIHMHTTNYPPESKDYWRQCGRDLNFDIPDKLDSVQATKSQRNQYHELISRIKEKRQALHMLHDDRLDDYRKKFE